jgi:cytochrome c oxidase subunit 2
MTRVHAAALPAAVLVAGVIAFVGTTAERTALRTVAAAAAQDAVDADLVKRGAKLARRSGCASCHSLDGSRRPGPTWKGLYGRKRPLANGQEVVADEAYLRRAILTPDAEIAQGFPKRMMPKNFAQKLSEEKIRAFIELIKSVR